MDIKALYTELLKQGKSTKDAAKEAQARTGISVVTGRPINRQLRFTEQTIYSGQYSLPSKGRR